MYWRGGLLVFLLVLVDHNIAEDLQTNQTDADAKENTLPDGHPLNCRKTISDRFDVFEVLPGTGWDNIQNTELSQVLNKSYYQCKLTEDGKYLIPDNVLLIPVKQSDVDIFAEWFSTMDEYRSVNSFSINAGASVSVGLPELGKVSGSFSAGYQSAKMHMSKSTTSKFISRVQARYNRYHILADPGAQLHPSFKSRLLEIALSLYNHHHQIAEYQCQLLIRDFGTHVLTRMNAGAVLYKEDHIDANTNSVDDAKKKQWQIGAGASFSLIFDGVSVGAGLQFGISKSKMEETIREYYNKTTFSVIKSYGGTYFDGNTSAGEWTKSLDNDLVSVDRDGIPVYELISTTTLPELPLDTLLKLGQSVKHAFISYYKHNTYRGCMNPNSKNFDIRANVANDAVCGGGKFDNEYFGGVYQTCTMTQTDAGDTCTDNGYIQKNPLTSDFSCPGGYRAIELISESITSSQYHERHPTFWHRKRHSYTTYSHGQYTAFWCAKDPTKTPDQKMFFGGVFSTNFKPNTVTGGFSCQPDFIPLRLADDIYVCASGNGNTIGLKFGGFFSCSNGNPLALTLNMTKTNAERIFDSTPNTWPKRCPHGMVQQTFSITSNCELEFCSDAVTKDGTPLSLPELIRPPFVKRPSVPPGNYSEMVIVVDGKWYKNEAAFEKMVEIEHLGAKIKSYQKAQDALDRASLAAADLYTGTGQTAGTDQTETTSDNEFATLPPYAIAIISSLATIVCLTIGLLAVVKCRKAQQGDKSHTRMKRNQDEIERVQIIAETNYGATDEGRNINNSTI